MRAEKESARARARERAQKHPMVNFILLLYFFLLVTAHARQFVTAPRSVVDIFGSTLPNIVTPNGCRCEILRNNSEFPART